MHPFLEGLALVLLLSILSTPFALAENRWAPPEAKAGKETKKKSEMIELLYDQPTRPFKRLGPVWATSMISMERAMKEAKKQAAKMGGDSIIDIKVGTSTSEMVTGSAGSWGGFVGGGSSPQPVIQGWAMKWE